MQTQDYFLKAVLYKKFPKEYVHNVENFDGTLDFFCLCCKRDSVFKRLDDTPNKIRARIPTPSFVGVPFVHQEEEDSRVF